MSEKVTLKFGKKVEHVEKKQSGEVVAQDTKTEHIPAGVQLEAEPWANVNVHLDARIGKPNYSSVGVGVSITLPCPVAEIDATFLKAKKWAEDRMTELTSEVA